MKQQEASFAAREAEAQAEVARQREQVAREAEELEARRRQLQAAEEEVSGLNRTLAQQRKELDRKWQADFACAGSLSPLRALSILCVCVCVCVTCVSSILVGSVSCF